MPEYNVCYISMCIYISNNDNFQCCRFVLSLENDLTVRVKTTEINVEDFSSGSYATVFGEEVIFPFFLCSFTLKHCCV